MPRYSKHAFNCAKCPEKGGDGGCPMWWETMWTNPAGDQKLMKSCGFEQLPVYLTEVVKASNRPAAAVESIRNDMAVRLGAIGQLICNGFGHGVIEGPRDAEAEE